MNVKWHGELYLGADAKKQKRKIQRSIKRNKFMLDVFLITLSSSEKNLLDILPSYMLLQDYHKEHCPLVVGIADGYEEALSLTAQIIDDVYQKTGAFEVRRYFEESD